METRHYPALEKFKRLVEEVERLHATNLSLTAKCQSLNKKNSELRHNEIKLENENQKLRRKLKRTKNEKKALIKQLELMQPSEAQVQIHSLQQQLMLRELTMSDEHSALMADIDFESQQEKSFAELQTELLKEELEFTVSNESLFDNHDLPMTDKEFFVNDTISQDFSNPGNPLDNSISASGSFYATPFVLIPAPRLMTTTQSEGDSCNATNTPPSPLQG